MRFAYMLNLDMQDVYINHFSLILYGILDYEKQ